MEAIDYFSVSDTGTMDVDFSRLSRAVKLFTEYHRYVQNLGDIDLEGSGESFFVNDSEVREFIKRNNYDVNGIASLVRSSATRVKTHSRHIFDAKRLLSENNSGFGSAVAALGEAFLSCKSMVSPSEEYEALLDQVVSRANQQRLMSGDELENWLDRIADGIVKSSK